LLRFQPIKGKQREAERKRRVSGFRFSVQPKDNHGGHGERGGAPEKKREIDIWPYLNT
jgi:hypothetical protein